ncbi:hypothetical protein EV361DRAFT_903027 [Lentinula raphanica]|nr:hypothetical protein F5880DRAFT_1609393 [Lentinula raphanica]KAJ3972882.1 hypothetical protein EV361DRAFT_903027 [Lentinula raphanica]
MSSSDNSTQVTSNNNDSDDQLGVSWEIGVIIGISEGYFHRRYDIILLKEFQVFIVIAVIAAAIFQRRNKRRLTRRLAEDLEKTQRRPDSIHVRPTKNRHSLSSSGTLKDPNEYTLGKDAADFDFTAQTVIRKPSPSLSISSGSKKTSRMKNNVEYVLQKPPSYYWDPRS